MAAGSLAQYEATGDGCYLDNSTADELRVMVRLLVARQDVVEGVVRRRAGGHVWDRAIRAARGEYELEATSRRGPDVTVLVDPMYWPQDNLNLDGCKHDPARADIEPLMAGGSARCAKCGTLMIGVVIVGDRDEVLL